MKDKNKSCSMAAVLASLVLPLAAQGKEAVLEEVIVTAEHRESSLQDAQVAVTALTSSDIEQYGISNAGEIGAIVPNLTMMQLTLGRTGFSPNMRGIGANEVLISFDPAVGLYMDDVLLSKNVGALIDVADMERIEVLRGPQGTLYGRNTIGGAINIITRKPVDVWEGSVKATLGKYGQRDLKGILNIPLADANSAMGALSVRATAATIHRDGLVDNTYEHRVVDELGTKDRDVLSLQTLWQPLDTLDVLYTYDRTEIDEYYDIPFVTEHDLDSYFGALISDFAVTHKKRPGSIMIDAPNRTRTDVSGHALKLDYRLSDNHTLKSITAHRKMKNAGVGDSDGTPINLLETDDAQKLDLVTQEFRLLGVALDGRLDYTLGAFYMREKGEMSIGLSFLGTETLMRGNFENSNWALYGQGTYALTDKWSLTAGLRYTEEKRELAKSEYNLGWIPGNDLDFPLVKNDFDNISPMVSIGYDWNDDTLLYFKVSTGYQAGGFNIRDTNPATYRLGFDEEKLIAYELGVKSMLGERIRINAAFWFSDYDDKTVSVINQENLTTYVNNAGVVEIYGAELEILAQLSNHVVMGFNYGYVHPEFKEYESPDPGNPEQIIDLSRSSNFPNTPRHDVSANLTFEYPLDTGLFSARVDWSYKDDHTFLVPSPERNYARSYQLWNARLTLDELPGPEKTSWRVSLWGKNLANEAYYVNGVNMYDSFGFDINLFGEPRTYGIDIELRF